jgi:hypothetical protein
LQTHTCGNSFSFDALIPTIKLSFSASDYNRGRTGRKFKPLVDKDGNHPPVFPCDNAAFKALSGTKNIPAVPVVSGLHEYLQFSFVNINAGTLRFR